MPKEPCGRTSPLGSFQGGLQDDVIRPAMRVNDITFSFVKSLGLNLSYAGRWH